MMRGSNMGILPYWLIILLITWGLGRIRTIATPLDRRNATASLGGLVEPEPLPCHLIGINATVSFGDLADLNHRHTYWGLGPV